MELFLVGCPIKIKKLAVDPLKIDLRAGLVVMILLVLAPAQIYRVVYGHMRLARSRKRIGKARVTTWVAGGRHGPEPRTTPKRGLLRAKEEDSGRGSGESSGSGPKCQVLEFPQIFNLKL